MAAVYLRRRLVLRRRRKRKRTGGLKWQRISEVELLGGSRIRTRFDRGNAEVRAVRTLTEATGLKGRAILTEAVDGRKRRRRKAVDLATLEEDRTTLLLPSLFLPSYLRPRSLV